MERLRSSAGTTSVAARLCPVFILRVGGLPVQVAQDLRAPDTHAALQRLFSLEEDLARKRAQTLDVLHELIGACDGDRAELRKAAINVRRAVYNERPVPARPLACLTADAIRQVRDLEDAAGQVDAADRVLRLTCERELCESRRRFRLLLDHVPFQRALLLSSRALYRAQEHYRKRPPEDVRTRDRKIERGLLKYYTRMAMKATPFATFCSVLPGRLVAEAEPGTSRAVLQLSDDPRPSQSEIRLNKAIFGMVVGALAKSGSVWPQMRVCLNPTLRKATPQSYSFLRVEGRRETIQRLPLNPALEAVTALLADAREKRTASELVHHLATACGLEDSPEEALEYIKRLVEIGFLHLTTSIPSQAADWDVSLCQLLSSSRGEPAARAISLLQKLRELSTGYADSSLADRASMLQAMDAHLDDFSRASGRQERLPYPLFEDATSNAAASLRRTQGIRQLERELSRYVQATSRLSPLRCELATMRCFFEVHYGPATNEVPMLTFFEDYYREYYRAHLEREKRGDSAADGYDALNPFGSDLVRRMIEAHARLMSLLRARWWGESSEAIEIDEIEAAVRDVPPWSHRGGWSVALFGELHADDDSGSQRFLVRGGTYTPGFGKMFSRFLYLFPQDFKDELRTRNREMSSSLLAELVGDTNFNANLHPPMLDAEISYPGVDGRDEADAISLRDVVVVRGRGEAEGLVLRHETSGRWVLPVDLSFLALKQRPPLFRLLAAFMPAPSFGLPVMPPPSRDGARPEEADRATMQAPRVRVLPRIHVGSSLQLTRKTWLVPGALYPRQREGELDRDYFVRVARWAREHEIPGEFYVRFQVDHASREHEEPTASMEAGEHNKDLLKPQYIDLSSPLLVSLFGHMAPAQGPFTAILEERLPSPASLVCYGDHQFASELVLQLDCPEERHDEVEAHAERALDRRRSVDSAHVGT